MNNSGYTSPTIFLRHSRCRVMTIPSDGSNLPHTFPGAAIPIYLAPSNNRTLLIIPCNSNYKTMQDILRSLTLTERSDKVGKEGPAALPTTTTTTSVRLDLPWAPDRPYRLLLRPRLRFLVHHSVWAPKETLTRRITYAQVEAWDAYAWNQLLDSFETLKSARDRQTDRLEWGMVVISLSKSSRKQLGATGILEEIKIHNFLNLRIIWLDFHLGKLSITPVREFLESLILPPSLEKLLLSVGISSSLSRRWYTQHSHKIPFLLVNAQFTIPMVLTASSTTIHWSSALVNPFWEMHCLRVLQLTFSEHYSNRDMNKSPEFYRCFLLGLSSMQM